MAQGIKYQLNLNAEIENLDKLKTQLNSLEKEPIDLKINTSDLNKQMQELTNQTEKLRVTTEKAGVSATANSKKQSKAINEVIKAQKELNKLLIQEAKLQASEKSTVELSIVQGQIKRQEELVQLKLTELKIDEKSTEYIELENKLLTENAKKVNQIYREKAKFSDRETTQVDRGQKKYLADLEKAEKKVRDLNIAHSKQVALLERISHMKSIPPNTIQDLDMATAEIEDLNREIKKATTLSNSFADSMKKATGTVLGLGSASMAIMTLTQAMTALIQTSYELNKQMTQLAMITGKTSSEMDALAESYTQMAMDLGATTAQVMSAADEFLLTRASI